MRARMSCRWLLRRGPWALMAAIAAFAASWRFSNCTIRAGNHRNKGAIKTKIVEIEIRVFLEFILPATMASDSASRARAVLAFFSTARRAAQEAPRQISS